MFPDVQLLEDNIVRLLQPLKTQRKVLPRAFPDEIGKEGIAINGLGVCLVAFKDSSAPEPTNDRFGKQNQELTLNFELVLIQRGGKSHRMAYPTIKLIVDLLAGQRIIDDRSYGNLFFQSVSYSGMTEEDNCWIYTLSLGLTYRASFGECFN